MGKNISYLCIIGELIIKIIKLIRLAKYIAISSFIWDNPKLKPELAIKNSNENNQTK